MNIYDDIKNGKYENKVERSLFNKPVHSLSDEELEKRQAQNNAYWKEESNLREQFKQDALVYVNMQEHPRAEFAFNKALDNRHSEGLTAVIDELIDLAYIAGTVENCGEL